MEDSITRELRKDHERVDQLRNQVEGARAEFLAGPSEERWRALCGAFRGLANHLDRHFTVEETDGFIVQILDRRPELADRAAELRNEHDNLRLELRDWSSLIDAEGDGDQRRTHAETELKRVLDALTEHESKEMRLLQETYLRDFGAPGTGGLVLSRSLSPGDGSGPGPRRRAGIAARRTHGGRSARAGAPRTPKG